MFVLKENKNTDMYITSGVFYSRLSYLLLLRVAVVLTLKGALIYTNRKSVSSGIAQTSG